MDIKNAVTFDTKCYFNDWEFIIKKNRLAKMIAACNYNFTCRTLILNNFDYHTEVRPYADDLIKNNIIDNYYLASDYEKQTLDFFDIKKESFNGGYYYSIAELVSIYLCKTPYLLHFSSDTILQRNTAINWVDEAIEVMENQNDIIVANPTWDFKYNEAKSESFAEDEKWYYGYGFSDQCYLVKTDNFRKNIYNEMHALSERYPKYGGELFEKRVDSYMRNHQLKRITSKHCSYIHQNFPKNKIMKYVKLKFSI